jgi:hypothetical protein
VHAPAIPDCSLSFCPRSEQWVLNLRAKTLYRVHRYARSTLPTDVLDAYGRNSVADL